MKLALKSETVFELFREMVGTDRYCDKGEAVCPRAPNPCYDPEADSTDKFDQTPGAENPGKKYIPFHGANYLVYDEHKDAPPGFALRVGRTAAVFLVDKRVNDKKLKIPVGLAAGKKGSQKPIPLTEARDQAWGLAQMAKKHGANPKGIADKVDAAELTFRQVWDDYITDLKARDTPIKPNSEDSLEKARNKFQDWEDRKVRLITAKEVMERFNLHAVKNGHRTAAEAMGRWAAAAVKNAIETEYHNAFSEGRPPSLTYNPFTILQTKKIYRSGKQLERAYAAKGIRNPMSFETAVGPYVREAWKYRKENSVSADFILLTLLWGLRRGESATFQWRDRISDSEAVYGRWIDMETSVGYVGDGKNRGDHEFAIGPCALELLKLRRSSQLADEAWVFPTSSPLSKKPYLSDPTQAMKTVKERAGIEIVRGHDLRRTFGAACEKLGFSDRQTKRLLGHAISGKESVGRYTQPEWIDMVDRMQRVEELILSRAPSVYNALRPKSLPRMQETEDVLVSAVASKASTRKPN